MTNRLLVVGWDAADWKVIRPLLAKGEMPHLAGLIAEGVSANLSTIFPPLSPMVWTSIATGKRPYKHGIHGFTEPTPDGLSIRPVSNLGRKSKAFWNILNQNGKRSIVVGWWPSHPAEPVRGVTVSDLFPLRTSADPSAPMAPGTVWPLSWAVRLAELRVHGMEIPGEILSLFVPEWKKIDQKKDKSLHDLAGIIAETMSIHAAATELIENERWDLAAVYYTGIDHFSHHFMRYHAHKHPRGGGENAELFSEVMANAYRYHDVMLGRLMALAGPETAVMVLSDHGFHSDRLLPEYIPAEPAGPAVEHREFGMFCLKAPGVLKGEQVYGANVMDIAPTVLHLFGLPAAKDMDGKVLINAFSDSTLPAPVESWEPIEGEDGRHPPSREYDGAVAVEALKQLVDLGYIAAPPVDARKAVAACVDENQYNLARAYLGADVPEPAAEILRQLVDRDSKEGRYYQLLFECHWQRGDWSEARRVLEEFDTACDRFAPQARQELARRQAERKPDDPPPQLDMAEVQRLRQLAEQAGGYAMERLLLRTRLALIDSRTPGPGRRAPARRLLEQLALAAGRKSQLALFLAEGFASLDEHERALEYVRRARRADPDDWRAMSLEARIHHAGGRYQQAVECGIESLALIYFQPTLHYLVGLSLQCLGEHERAEHQFRIALAQRPDSAPAHEQLAGLARRESKLGEAALHMAHAQVIRKKQLKPTPIEVGPKHLDLTGFERWDGTAPDRSRAVVVVAGLPRSGTSMMMQVLAAAGIAPYTDGLRTADSDNPRGYFEHEQATTLHRDVSWVPQARGKAVKIVANLVPYLPKGEQYRIVFMLRNLEEVAASQRVMLDRLGRPGAQLDAGQLARVYTGQLVRVCTWLSSRPEIQVLAVDYSRALRDPTTVVARLASFLGEPFEQASAAAKVDPSLRRQHAESEVAATAAS
jgi:predicted AlkP superfamily phosphohydrolase/phosphomutase/tetratricopeptide (TPR) repeat protein